ncbi:Fms-interacting protein-domain-containing protein [Dendryphion nanum]|uniref:Fms-interacting protein-domain-containing protein n=1 Tax=Dendryphion nanum TaxID=256645 RepID=A0A9P9E714_9PLEO|nr:Fms-interacting protein-domain-containing protein [Dendryphion nanum]
MVKKVSDQIKTAHNRALFEANQQLANKVDELVEFQLKNPEASKPSSRTEIDHEKQVQITIERKKKEIRAQLALIKTLYRQSVLKVREEKAATSESRNINDTLILQLHNLKYEEQSLASEISAAQNYDHKYKKLPLISVEEFLEQFPEHAAASDHEIMTARIEHEYQGRLKLEERRQEKLKQKQILIAEVKKRKDDLTKLDGMLEKFIEAAEPIQKALATE